MNDVLAAIITRFLADATLATAGGPWLDVAKDDATYPHCVYQITGGGHDPRFGSYYDETVNVRFILSDDNLADAITLQNALHDSFDEHRLLAAGSFPMIRTNQFVSHYGAVDKNGVKVYRAVSDYRVTTRKSN